MSPIQVNSDLGESVGIHSFGNDEALLAVVDTVNVACGFHAGHPGAMHRTVQEAAARQVTVGAHPGLADITGFGRREMALDADEVRDLVRYQVGALSGFLDVAGVPLHHIKPHGALFAMTARDERLMGAVCDVAEQYAVPVFGLAGTAHETVSAQRGVDFVPELYVDLDYADDGMVIISRQGTDRDLDDVEARVRSAVVDGVVTTASGATLTVAPRTICVHSDLPGAPAVAQRVRAVLTQLAEHAAG